MLIKWMSIAILRAAKSNVDSLVMATISENIVIQMGFVTGREISNDVNDVVYSIVLGEAFIFSQSKEYIPHPISPNLQMPRVTLKDFSIWKESQTRTLEVDDIANIISAEIRALVDRKPVFLKRVRGINLTWVLTLFSITVRA